MQVAMQHTKAVDLVKRVQQLAAQRKVCLRLPVPCNALRMGVGMT